MAQVSYGTITITDTTDLTTYIRYATKAPLTAASQFQETPTTDTRYIAVLSIPTSDSIPAWNSSSWKWSEFIGTDGLSVKNTRVLYYLKTNSANVPQVDKNTSIASTDTQNAWTSKNPTYVANGTYWTCLEVTLSDNTTKSWSAPTEDLGLTQTAKDTAEAKSIAQQTIEDSQGALSIATGINQHFFSIPSDYSTSVPAGSYITEINVSEFKQSPSGGNLLTRSDGVWLRNGADILASLQGTGLTFLIPTGTYKGRKSLEILGGTTPALKLYDAQNNSAVATLNSSGLVLSKGGIRVNTVGSNNGVYISSENLGSIVTSLDAKKTNWRAVIGSKFGVDSEGNLYANNAKVTGAIKAQSLTIESNATINDTSGLIRNDAIEVGGRNLLIGTPNFHLTNGSVLDTKTNFMLYVWTTPEKTYSGYKSIMPAKVYSSPGHITETFVAQNDSLSYFCIKHNGTKHDYNVFFDAPIEAVKAGETYTLSFDIIGANPSVENGLDVKNFKLEKGNKATDWSPAPEDVEASIELKVSSTDYNGETIASIINQSAEEIKISADHVELDARLMYLWVDDKGVHISKTPRGDIDPPREVLLTDSSINIMVEGIAVAQFGEDVIIGDDASGGKSKIVMDESGIDFIDNTSQLKLGYDDSREVYGTISKNYFVYGNGASIKFDSSAEAQSRGKFIQEIRDNGHWSMKQY